MKMTYPLVTQKT